MISRSVQGYEQKLEPFVTVSSTSKSPLLAIPGKRVVSYRYVLVVTLALAVVVGIWFGLPVLSVHARLALITFSVAVLGWIFTDINDP